VSDTRASGQAQRVEPQTVIIVIAIVMIAVIAWRSFR
jgi:hypothetical protein